MHNFSESVGEYLTLTEYRKSGCRNINLVSHEELEHKYVESWCIYNCYVKFSETGEDTSIMATTKDDKPHFCMERKNIVLAKIT